MLESLKIPQALLDMNEMKGELNQIKGEVQFQRGSILAVEHDQVREKDRADALATRIEDLETRYVFLNREIKRLWKYISILADKAEVNPEAIDETDL